MQEITLAKMQKPIDWLNPPTEKVCKRCKEKKDMKEFPVDGQMADNRKAYCNTCMNEFSQAHKRKVKQGQFNPFGL